MLHFERTHRSRRPPTRCLDKKKFKGAESELIEDYCDILNQMENAWRDSLACNKL